jgi:hypothetical protein
MTDAAGRQGQRARSSIASAAGAHRAPARHRVDAAGLARTRKPSQSPSKELAESRLSSGSSAPFVGQESPTAPRMHFSLVNNRLKMDPSASSQRFRYQIKHLASKGCRKSTKVAGCSDRLKSVKIACHRRRMQVTSSGLPAAPTLCTSSLESSLVSAILREVAPHHLPGTAAPLDCPAASASESGPSRSARRSGHPRAGNGVRQRRLRPCCSCPATVGCVAWIPSRPPCHFGTGTTTSSVFRSSYPK